MKNKVKIGELNFELTLPRDETELPRLEIENDASMVFVRLERSDAENLKHLLERYLSHLDQAGQNFLANEG